MNQTLNKLEQDIAELEASLKAAEAELAKEAIYSHPEKLAETTRNYQQLEPRLLKAQQEWERLMEEIILRETK